MSLAYIRESYGVPAKRGGRVEYSGRQPSRFGTIIDADGARLRIRLDGERHSGIYHPTWCIRYLDASPSPRLPLVRKLASHA